MKLSKERRKLEVVELLEEEPHHEAGKTLNFIIALKRKAVPSNKRNQITSVYKITTPINHNRKARSSNKTKNPRGKVDKFSL